jgi:putative tricarboxylic transport membrane protein
MYVRITKALPYFIVLAIAAALFVQLGQLGAVASGGMGPALWPKAILMMTMIVCVYEIVKRLMAKSQLQEASGVLESIVEESGEEAVDSEPPAEKRYPHLLWLGIGLTLAYVALIETLGFFISTFLFLAVFIWIGRYRHPGVVIVVSLLGSLTFSFIFMKVVYVSLPLGRGPFQQLSILLMQLMGVK